ncbi:MAG: hypothetical protein M1438_14450 [Deltaproteobacteria bacterium]|nr:hypothetical protein [Deltaproteobacteria bacterium]
MTRLPAVTSTLMMKFLQDMGFQKSRQRGSHIFFHIPTGALQQSRFIRGKIWVGGLPAKYFMT